LLFDPQIPQSARTALSEAQNAVTAAVRVAMTEGWEEFSNYVIEDFEDGFNPECFGFPTGFGKQPRRLKSPAYSAGCLLPSFAHAKISQHATEEAAGHGT